MFTKMEAITSLAPNLPEAHTTLFCRKTESKWSLINQLNMARRLLGNLMSLISCIEPGFPFVFPALLNNCCQGLKDKISNRHAHRVSQEASLCTICHVADAASYFSTVRKVWWVWNVINITDEIPHGNRRNLSVNTSLVDCRTTCQYLVWNYIRISSKFLGVSLHIPRNVFRMLIHPGYYIPWPFFFKENWMIIILELIANFANGGREEIEWNLRFWKRHKSNLFMTCLLIYIPRPSLVTPSLGRENRKVSSSFLLWVNELWVNIPLEWKNWKGCINLPCPRVLKSIPVFSHNGFPESTSKVGFIVPIRKLLQ